MAGGNALQSRGAERLKALPPMGGRRAEGAVRWDRGGGAEGRGHWDEVV